MKITTQWLEDVGACCKAKATHQKQIEADAVKLLRQLVKGSYLLKDIPEKERLEWATWAISRLLPHQDKVRYAVFAAEQVITIFEKDYPKDHRPREAIAAAKKWAETPTEENRIAGAYAAHAAAHAARAAEYNAMLKRIVEHGITLVEANGDTT